MFPQYALQPQLPVQRIKESQLGCGWQERLHFFKEEELEQTVGLERVPKRKERETNALVSDIPLARCPLGRLRIRPPGGRRMVMVTLGQQVSC